MRQISIHALREEGDPGCAASVVETTVFLSTPSARRATRSGWPAGYRLAISIHALREEGDGLVALEVVQETGFLSTPSARRATVRGARYCCLRG